MEIGLIPGAIIVMAVFFLGLIGLMWAIHKWG